MASFLDPLLGPPGNFRLVDVTTGAVLARTIETAFDSTTRKRGLLGRERLEPGHALVLAPCNAVHTFFMRFPIDVLLIRRDGRVVKVSHDVQAWRVAVALTAFATVELPAGWARQSRVSKGDTVLVEPLVST